MSYQTKLNELVKQGASVEYIASALWASYSSQHNLTKITDDVEAAVILRDAEKTSSVQGDKS
jgi:hypothetical protein